MKRKLLALAALVAVAATNAEADPIDRPANDDLANATSIGSLPFDAVVTTEGATPDDDELPWAVPGCGSMAAGSIWFKVEAGVARSFRIVGSAGSGNWMVAALVGSTPTSLRDAGCIDDRASSSYPRDIEFSIRETDALYLRVHGPELLDPAELRLQITEGSIDAPLRPARNDLLEDATEIATLPFEDAPEIWTATQSASDPTLCYANSEEGRGDDAPRDIGPVRDDHWIGTVWYRFEPSRSAQIVVEVEDTPSVAFSVYRETATGIELVECESEAASWRNAQNNHLGFAARIGDVYLIEVLADDLFRQPYRIRVSEAPTMDLAVEAVGLEADVDDSGMAVPGRSTIRATVRVVDGGSASNARATFTVCHPTSTRCWEIDRVEFSVSPAGTTVTADWDHATCTGHHLVRVELVHDSERDPNLHNDQREVNVHFPANSFVWTC